MWRRGFKFSSACGLGLATLTAAGTVTSRALAQACCAGGSAVTPARLELHEQALAGAELRAGGALGSYEPDGHYLRNPSGDTELDFEQDLFGAFRVLRRGQLALLVPLVETQRQTQKDGGHIGGGIGDVNASLRYDFVVAGESRYVPGVALLAGLTFPTGTAPESATAPLAVDATGIGAWQANVALALEQTYGPWLINATGLAAKRTARFGQTLGTQVTLLAAGAYTFDNDAAVALTASYAFEGDATASGGMSIPESAKRLTTLSLSVLWPVNDLWRLFGGLYVEPTVSGFGTNQPAVSGFTLTVIRSWS
jgi:hypothetical protein